MSRYSPFHERTFARWYDTPFDWVSFNKAAITKVVPSEHEQALVIDASFVPKSGKHTYSLDRFWNGSHSRAEKGLEISTLAWLDLTGNSVVLCIKADLSFLRYVLTDGAYSNQKFVAGVVAFGMHQIGKLRANANLRYLYQGPKRPGRGRQKSYDGKVYFSDLSRFESPQLSHKSPFLRGKKPGTPWIIPTAFYR